jgi:DNA-binding response OmpR family regulator
MARPVPEPWFTRPHDDEALVEAIYIGGDGALADLYRFKLEMDGYRVRLASTGTEGLGLARTRLPDIVFIDLGPADQSLLETHRIMRRDQVLKDIPAVLLWRGDTDAPTIRSLGLGGKDFVVKATGAHPDHALAAMSNDRIPFRFAP